MTSYDPEKPPNPEQWLALDEQIRIKQAEDYHRLAGIKLPKAKAHAIFHAIVENQIAEGLASVVQTMARLSKEGLTRHEAIHAIASVLAEHLNELFHAKAGENKSIANYTTAVERLSGPKWRAG